LDLAAFAVASTFTFATILAFATVVVTTAFAAALAFATVFAFAVVFTRIAARRVGAGTLILRVCFDCRSAHYQSGDGRSNEECSLCSAHSYFWFLLTSQRQTFAAAR
jgi:hypothetical protein